LFRKRRNNSHRDETIFGFWRITEETANGLSTSPTATVAPPAAEPGDKSMRSLGFILAFGLVLAGSSLAGAPDGNLPGVGTFRYSGSPVTTTAPQPIVVAARF
jgi:hypothetical protein